MRKLHIVLFLIFGLSAPRIQAQIPYEGNRVLSYQNKLVCGVFTSIRQFSMYMEPINAQGEGIDSLSSKYEPNSNRLIGANIVSGDLGIRFSIKVPQLNSEIERSETSEFGIGLSLYKRRNIWEGFYGAYDGLVDRNKTKYSKDPQTKPEDYVRKDIHVRSAKLEYTHIFKPDRYSLRAGYYYNERMLKSGGSFNVRSRYHFLKTTADSSFIPGSGDSIVVHNQLDLWRVHSLGLGGGYAYSIVIWEYFFIDFGVLFGLDFQMQKYGFSNSESIERTVINPLFDFQFATGWSEDRYYVVFRLDYDFNNLSMSSAEIRLTQLTPTLGFGIRLDAPKKLSEVKDKFNLR